MIGHFRPYHESAATGYRVRISAGGLTMHPAGLVSFLRRLRLLRFRLLWHPLRVLR